MSANVWKLLVSQGDLVEPETDIVILESMKMEIPVATEVSGTVAELRVAEGDSIDEDDVIAVIQ